MTRYLRGAGGRWYNIAVASSFREMFGGGA